MADVEGMTARNDSRHEPSSSAKKTDNTATSGYNLRERRRRPNPDYADFVAGMHRARFGDSDSYSDPPSTTKKESQRVQTESHKRRKVGTAAPGPPPDPVVPAAWDTGFRSVPAICSLSSDKNPEAETLDPDRGDGGGDSPVVWQDAAGDPAPGSPPPHDDPIATATPISSLTLLAPPSRLSQVTSGSKEREVPDSDVAPVAGGKRVCNFRADWLRNVLQHRAPSSKPEKLPLAPQAQRPPRPTPNPAVTSDTACVGPSPLRHPPQGDASSSAIAVLLEMLRPLAKEGALHTLSNQALEDACRKLRVSIPSHRKADMIPRLCLRIGVHPDLKIEPRESSRHALPDRGPADAQDLKFEPQLGGEQPEDPGDGEPARPTSSGGQSDRTQSVRTPGHHGRLHPAYRSELLARGAHVTPIQTYAGRGSGSVSSADDDDASIPAPLALAHPKPSDLYRHEDHTDVVDGHARQCAEWLRRARRVVVLTGPPGPPDPRAKTWAAMRRLQPTATHAAVATLAARGHVAHVITTAVDDHHQRSGLPPNLITELYGNAFTAVCVECGHRLRASRPVRITSHPDWEHATHRRCPDCGSGATVDTIVTFGECLPESQLERAVAASQRAELLLVLGNPLTMAPASRFPALCLKAGGRMVVCSPIETRYSNRPNVLTVCAATDHFMARVTRWLDTDAS